MGVYRKILRTLKARTNQADNSGEISDGYHTFNELYEFRLLYNAALFNEWSRQKKYKVHKSLHHADMPYEPIFGGGWFVVVAELPTGQISNHYQDQYYDLFRIPETPVAHAWDGHTAADVAIRLKRHIEGNDLATNNPNANTDLSNPQEQRIAEYKQLLKSVEKAKEWDGTTWASDDYWKGRQAGLDQCRALIAARIKELEGSHD